VGEVFKKAIGPVVMTELQAC